MSGLGEWLMGTPDRPEVDNWETDFDHLHNDYAADPYPIWKEMREGGCPVAHTDRFHGVYLPTRHEDISSSHMTPNTSPRNRC